MRVNSKVESTLSTKIKDLQEMVKSLKLKAEEMSESKDKSIADLQSQIDSVIKAKKKLEEKLDDSKEIIKQKDDKLEEMDKHKAKETTVIENLRKELEKYKKNNTELTSK